MVGFGLRIGILTRAPSRPWKIGIVSPGRTCTIAFFHWRVRPAVWPRRLGLLFTKAVRTATTFTSNSCSIAWRIWVLCARSCTRKVYLPASASTNVFSETTGRMIT